jgi:hypothetical protein
LGLIGFEMALIGAIKPIFRARRFALRYRAYEGAKYHTKDHEEDRLHSFVTFVSARRAS